MVKKMEWAMENRKVLLDNHGNLGPLGATAPICTRKRKVFGALAKAAAGSTSAASRKRGCE